MYRDYTDHVIAEKDPEEFLEKIVNKHNWPDGSPATDYAAKFARNVRLFRYFHVFLFTTTISRADLFAGRCVVCAIVVHACAPHSPTLIYSTTNADFRLNWVRTNHSRAAEGGDAISQCKNCSPTSCPEGSCVFACDI